MQTELYNTIISSGTSGKTSGKITVINTSIDIWINIKCYDALTHTFDLTIFSMKGYGNKHIDI